MLNNTRPCLQVRTQTAHRLNDPVRYNPVRHHPLRNPNGTRSAHNERSSAFPGRLSRLTVQFCTEGLPDPVYSADCCRQTAVDQAVYHVRDPTVGWTGPRSSQQRYCGGQRTGLEGRMTSGQGWMACETHHSCMHACPWPAHVRRDSFTGSSTARLSEALSL